MSRGDKLSQKSTSAGRAANLPPAQGGGIFNVAPGSGAAFARKVLGTGVAAAPFVPSAWNFGADMGNRVNEWLGRGARTDEGLVTGDRGRRMLRERELEQMFGGGLPSVEQITGATAAPVSSAAPQAKPGVISQEPAAAVTPYVPEEFMSPAIVTPEETPATVSFQMPEQAPAAAAEPEVEILGDPDTIVQEDPNDLYAQYLEAIASQPPRTIEREGVDPTAKETLAKATTNRVERPVPPETFGRKVKRFVSSLSGDTYDPTRLDKLELELWQAQNRLTQPEALGADVAANNIRDSKQFNRAATMAEYGRGGVDPMTQIALDLLKGERINYLQGQREATGRRETHANQVDLIGRSAAAAKLSPEHMKAQALWNMAEKNPDGFASFIEQQTGYQLPPEFIKSMMESRSKNNAENERFQMVLNMLPNIAGGAARKPLNVSSVPKKD